MALVAESVKRSGVEELLLFRDAVETAKQSAKKSRQPADLHSGDLEIENYERKLNRMRVERAAVPFMNPTAEHAAVLNKLLLTSASETPKSRIGIISNCLSDDIWAKSCAVVDALKSSNAAIRIVLMHNPEYWAKTSKFAERLEAAKKDGLNVKVIYWEISRPEGLQHITIVNDDQYRFEVLADENGGVDPETRDFLPARGSFNGKYIGGFLRDRFDEIWKRAVSKASAGQRETPYLWEDLGTQH